jgi:hypothetical protein
VLDSRNTLGRVADATFKQVYQALKNNYIKKFDFTNKTDGPLQAYQAATGQRIKANRLWAATRTKYMVGKTNNLLWRLLYGRLLTGTDVFWNPVNRQNCPIHGVDFT